MCLQACTFVVTIHTNNAEFGTFHCHFNCNVQCRISVQLLGYIMQQVSQHLQICTYVYLYSTLVSMKTCLESYCCIDRLVTLSAMLIDNYDLHMYNTQPRVGSILMYLVIMCEKSYQFLYSYKPVLGCLYQMLQQLQEANCELHYTYPTLLYIIIEQDKLFSILQPLLKHTYSQLLLVLPQQLEFP